MVMQATDVWDLNDRAEGRWLRSPRDGSILVQREVRSPFVIVNKVALQVAAQRALVPDDDMIEALAPEGADHAFNELIGVSSQLHHQRAVRHKPFVLPIPSIRCVAGRFS